MDLTKTDLTDKEFKAELTQCFKNINYLFEKEIILFGDVQLLLDTTTVYWLARELASKMYGRDLVTMSVSITLLNAVFVLIKRKATDEARKVLNATCQLRTFSQWFINRDKNQFSEDFIELYRFR